MSDTLLFSRDLWQYLQTQTRDILLYGMGTARTSSLPFASKRAFASVEFSPATALCAGTAFTACA